MIKWVLVSMLFGQGAPIPNTPIFDTESGCILFLHNTMGDEVARSFRVACVQKTDPGGISLRFHMPHCQKDSDGTTVCTMRKLQ